MDSTVVAKIYEGHILELGSKSIRLLHLLSGQDGDPIKGTLSVANLNRAGEFEALSYVWGDRDVKQTVCIDGVHHRVTNKLFDALVSLRRPDLTRILWIDAISINQHDNTERNHQVRIMGDIYSSAVRVLVWLGAETENSRIAFDFLTRAYFGTPSSRRNLKDDKGWLAMQDLYDREYWTRVWIVQEVCLAREAVIICGQSQIPWIYLSELRKTRTHIRTQSLSDGEARFRRSLMAQLDEVRSVSQAKGCTLWTLLESFQNLNCYAIHDKIYGFMGLTGTFHHDHELPIDYSKTVKQLFGDVISFSYHEFSNDGSSPHSAQLIAFTEFLQRYLRGHGAYEGDLDFGQAGTSFQDNIELSISAFAVFRVERIPTMDGDHDLESCMPTAVALDYSDPLFSDTYFWGKDLEDHLATVFATASSSSFAALESEAYLDKSPQPDNMYSLPLNGRFPVVAKYGFHNGSLQSEVAAIVPAGTQIGDLLCTFLDSRLVLAFRRKLNVEGEYLLSGRANLDFRAMERLMELKGRLTTEKTAELLVSNKLSENLVPWPVTVHLNLFELQVLTDPTKKFQHSSKTRSSQRANWQISPFDIDFRRIDTSHTTRAHQHSRRIFHHPAPYTGISNLGVADYMSCAMRLLYHLKPIRKALKDSVLEPQMRQLSSIRDLFHDLLYGKFTRHNPDMPVSPAAVMQSFNWSTNENNQSQLFWSFWMALMDTFTEVHSLYETQEKLLVGRYAWHTPDLVSNIDFNSLPFNPVRAPFMRLMIRGAGISNSEHQKIQQRRHRAAESAKLDDALPLVEHARGFKVFHRLPPILLLRPEFRDRVTSHPMTKFSRLQSLDFAEEADLSEDAASDAKYELHGIVMEEYIKPISRHIFYLRPREDAEPHGQWVLFKNERVEYVTSDQVFEGLHTAEGTTLRPWMDECYQSDQDDFSTSSEDETETSSPKHSPLRTPVMLIYLRKSMVHELLD